MAIVCTELSTEIRRRCLVLTTRLHAAACEEHPAPLADITETFESLTMPNCCRSATSLMLPGTELAR